MEKLQAQINGLKLVIVVLLANSLLVWLVLAGVIG